MELSARSLQLAYTNNNNKKKKNSKRAYQLVKDLTSEKQGRSSTIQDKSG